MSFMELSVLYVVLFMLVKWAFTYKNEWTRYDMNSP